MTREDTSHAEAGVPLRLRDRRGADYTILLHEVLTERSHRRWIGTQATPKGSIKVNLHSYRVGDFGGLSRGLPSIPGVGPIINEMTDRLDQSLGKAQRIEALIIYEASGQAASQKLDIHFGGGRKTHTQARGGNQEFRVMDPEGLVEGLTHSPNQADLDGQRLSD